MPENCVVIAIFPIYGEVGAIWKSDSARRVCKMYIFINSNLTYYQNWRKNCQNWRQKQKVCNTSLTL